MRKTKIFMNKKLQLDLSISESKIVLSESKIVIHEFLYDYVKTKHEKKDNHVTWIQVVLLPT